MEVEKGQTETKNKHVYIKLTLIDSLEFPLNKVCSSSERCPRFQLSLFSSEDYFLLFPLHLIDPILMPKPHPDLSFHLSVMFLIFPLQKAFVSVGD